MSEHAGGGPPAGAATGIPGSRHAILVDVGYLYAAVGLLVVGSPTRRTFRVAADGLVSALLRRAGRQVPGDLLRVYWYDAARDRVPTVEQRQIAALPHVKVRLGNLNSAGQQKGVDAQVRQDLEVLARHRAVSDVVLLAGDEDFLPAVEVAQAYGVRVHVWGVEPPYGVNQAERLVWEADTVDELDAEFCRPYVLAEPARSGADQRAGADLLSAVRLSGVRVPAGPPDARPVDEAAPAAGATLGPAMHSSTAAGSAVPAADGAAGADRTGANGAAGVDAGHPNGAVVLGNPGLDAQPECAEAGPGTAAPAGEGVTGGAKTLVPTPAEVFAARRPAVQAPQRLGPERATMEEIGERIAGKWLVTRGRDNVADLLPGPLLPTVIDKELLIEAEQELRRSLRPYEDARRALRDGFWARLHREFGVTLGVSGASAAADSPP